MRVRVPQALAVEITAIELTVLDEDAECAPPDASGGQSVGTFALELGQTRTLKVSPGRRTFSVVAFDSRTPVARGCDQQELVAGETHTVNIDLVEFPPPIDGAPPDAPPPDGPPPPFNDDCTTAGALTPGDPRTDSSLGANDDEDGTCAVGASRDLLYSYTLAEPRRVHLSVTTDYDAAVSLRSPDCLDQQDEALCVDETPGAGVEVIDVRTQAAGTYFVVVDGMDGEAGEAEVLLETADPPPPGDGCSEVQTLSTGSTIGQVLSAAYGADDTGTCGGAGRDRVYQFPLASPRQVDIATRGDLAHAIYLRAGACEGGAEQDCATSSGAGANQTAGLHFDELPAGIYFLFVDAAAADAAGTLEITLTVSSAATPPPNDMCAAPEDLVAGLTEIGTVDAARDDEVLSCAPGGNTDVFFRFTLATDRSVVVSLDSAFDSALSLQSAGCGAELECVNSAPAGELLRLGNLEAGTYVLAVEAIGGVTGDFTIGYTTGPPRPINDACEGALLLFPDTPRTSQVMTDALDDEAGDCEAGADPDVVYRFVVPEPAPRRVRLSVSDAAGFDPYLHVHENQCDGAELGCADTSSGAGDLLDLPSVPPGSYYVWVEAKGGGSGTFTLLYQLLDEVPPPGNDACEAPDFMMEAVAQSGQTIGAADDYDLSCAGEGGRDTVHELSIASPRALLISAEPLDPSWNLAAALRLAGECALDGDLGCTGSAFATRFLNKPNLPADDYAVVVDGVDGASGEYTITYETRPADATFGYWIRTDSAPYQPLTGATSVPIGLGGPINGAGDEGFYLLSIPFSFPFFGETYTVVYAHANMLLTFTSPPGGADAYNNDCPIDEGNPHDAIYPFWTDGYAPDAAPAGQLLHLTEGVAPNRRFTIEYRNWDIFHCPTAGDCGALGARVTHQVVLYESGDIELRYGPRAAAPITKGCGTQHLGCLATIGIEGSILGADDPDQVQCNTGTVAEGQVVYFVYPR